MAEKLMDYLHFKHAPDPETGEEKEICERPVIEVHKAHETYRGDQLGHAPDLIVGHKRGYRGGDDSALGDIPESVIKLNRSSWSGDHCIAVSEVPGIVVTNRRLKKPDPALIDIGPTVLELFGLPVPEDMDGKPIF